MLNYTMSLYPSSTPSGGSTVAAVPLRSGAAAAGATIKTGASISGTGYPLHFEEVYNQNPAGSGVVSNMNSNYAPPFDLIMSSGATLWVVMQYSGYASPTFTTIIYFEELHLARSR